MATQVAVSLRNGSEIILPVSEPAVFEPCRYLNFFPLNKTYYLFKKFLFRIYLQGDTGLFLEFQYFFYFNNLFSNSVKTEVKLFTTSLIDSGRLSHKDIKTTGC